MEEKVSVEQLLYRLKNEGEYYALKHYFGRDIECEDPESERLWKEAYDSLENLYTYLEQKVEDKRWEG